MSEYWSDSHNEVLTFTRVFPGAHISAVCAAFESVGGKGKKLIDGVLGGLQSSTMTRYSASAHEVSYGGSLASNLPARVAIKTTSHGVQVTVGVKKSAADGVGEFNGAWIFLTLMTCGLWAVFAIGYTGLTAAIRHKAGQTLLHKIEMRLASAR